nr:g-type lectin s-receptor-like serine/threonine-protein kinase [Quercus suber]
MNAEVGDTPFSSCILVVGLICTVAEVHCFSAALYSNRGIQLSFMATNVQLLKFLFLLLFFSSLWTPHAQQVPDTLKPGDMLTSSSRLVSSEGRFTLTFTWSSLFERNCTFLVISSTSGPSKTYLWISGANDSNVLGLENKTGALIIMGQAGNLMTLHSSTQPTNNTVATLLDSGNFIFQEVYSNGSTKRVLWQSFDNPGNTLVPGMKLGINHKTGQTWSLRSWLTRDLPIPGPFSLGWDGSQLVIRRREVVYWKSGFLRENQFENISPNLTSMYHFNIVSNDDEESFSFEFDSENQNQPSQWTLTDMGRLHEGQKSMAQTDECYGYNTDGGCQMWNLSMCRQPGYTVELNRSYLVNGDASYTIPDPNLGMIDCKANCSANCRCVAYTTLLGNWTGCRFWTTISNFTPTDMENSDQVYILSPKSSQTETVPTRENSTTQPGKTKRLWIVIAIAIGTIALLEILFCILCYLHRRRITVLQGNNDKQLLSSEISVGENGIPNNRKKAHDVSVFSYECITTATNNFSLESKLGEGGFGPVYKGKLPTAWTTSYLIHIEASY